MSNSKRGQLNLNDRINISRLLDLGNSLRKTAEIICRSVTTISNELKNRRIIHGELSPGGYLNYKLCDRLIKAPFVCNGCESKPNCKKRIKYFYDPYKADEQYRETLSSSRSGPRLSDQAMNYVNKTVSPLIKENKQSINHILASNEVGVSESTLYRYIDQGYLDAKNIDLKRKVRYKPRAVSKDNQSSKEDKPTTLGRKYIDFLAYADANPKCRISEMDTVYGKKEESKCILTFLLRKNDFFLGFVLENRKAETVVKKLNEIEATIGKARFMTHFNILLTDNGSEFYGIDEMEANDRKIKRCTVFFCDPSQSQQKGALERTHEYIREYYPKGASIEDLTQRRLNLMLSHINSVKRKKLGNRSPFDKLTQGELNDMKKLGLYPIDPKKVIMDKTKLFKILDPGYESKK